MQKVSGGRLHVDDPDDLPGDLAARVRAQMGGQAKGQANPPPPPPPQSPDAPKAALVPMWLVRPLAEAAGLEAVYRMAPMAGLPWASRCHSARLKPMRGLLGRPAVWTYECRGEAHTGWLFAGSWWTWRVVLDAATGEVLAAEAKGG